MDNFKTISELARSLSTSTDTIRRAIKKHQISTEKINGVTALNEAAQEQLTAKLMQRSCDAEPQSCDALATQNCKNATHLRRTCDAQTENSQKLQQDCDAELQKCDALATHLQRSCDAEPQTDNAQLELYKTRIEELQKQLTAAENQINDLKADKSKLYDNIESLLSQLSAETKERQAILTKYMLLEQKEQAAESSGGNPEDDTAADPERTENKKSFFARLFKRK